MYPILRQKSIWPPFLACTPNHLWWQLKLAAFSRPQRSSLALVFYASLLSLTSSCLTLPNCVDGLAAIPTTGRPPLLAPSLLLPQFWNKRNLPSTVILRAMPALFFFIEPMLAPREHTTEMKGSAAPEGQCCRESKANLVTNQAPTRDREILGIKLQYWELKRGKIF